MIQLFSLFVFLCRSSARVLLSGQKPAVHKPGKWTKVLYTSLASLTVGGGLCAVPFKQVSLSPTGTNMWKNYSSDLQYQAHRTLSSRVCCSVDFGTILRRSLLCNILLFCSTSSIWLVLVTLQSKIFHTTFVRLFKYNILFTARSSETIW